MGGRKIGTDKVLGYTCDVWELMDTKQCIYKGVTLKVESNIMGMTNREIATETKFDIALSADDFKLPNFPVQEGAAPMGQVPDRQSGGMTMPQPSETDIAKMAEAVKVMSAAMQKSGIDMNKPNMSAEDQHKLENALMGALMPQMKQQLIEQEKAMQFAKRCLTEANTLNQAQKCASKVDAMMGEAGEPLERWDARTKEETLHEIDRALAGVACAKKAHTPQAIERCMQQ